MTPQETIEQIKFKYHQMPNWGAALHVRRNGEIDNGTFILAKFADAAEARKALTAAGFSRNSYGWKLTR